MAIPLALCFVATAPILLRAFGGEYAAHSTTTLRLLALSAIPHMVNALYMSVYRVRLKMSAVVAILGALCSLVLVLGTVLLQVIGIAGIGIAWLVSELVVVAVLVAVDPRALWPLRGR
jgi:O-antigen/teichoic acid export membrane protein